MKKRAAALGLEWSEDSLVFWNTRNKIVQYGNLKESLSKIYRKAGIEDATMHTLRHTYATRCFEAGVEIKLVSNQLGHSSVKLHMIHMSTSLRILKQERSINCLRLMNFLHWKRQQRAPLSFHSRRRERRSNGGRPGSCGERLPGFYRIFTASRLGVGGGPWDWLGGRWRENHDK